MEKAIDLDEIVGPSSVWGCQSWICLSRCVKSTFTRPNTVAVRVLSGWVVGVQFGMLKQNSMHWGLRNNRISFSESWRLRPGCAVSVWWEPLWAAESHFFAGFSHGVKEAKGALWGPFSRALSHS